MASSEVDTQDLSRREREAMDIVYRLGRATALEIRAQMAQPPTDAAVRTTLRILVRKGRLKQEYDGPRFVYFPTLAREAARRSAFRPSSCSLLRQITDSELCQPPKMSTYPVDT